MAVKPENLVAIIDSREQQPLDLSPIGKVEVRGLSTGDYSLVGFEDQIAIERKSLQDFVQCVVGKNRERFEKELHRLMAYPCRAVVLEASYPHLEQPENWKGNVTPNAVMGSLLAWQRRFEVPFLCCGNRKTAGRMIARMMWQYAAEWERDIAKRLKLIS